MQPIADISRDELKDSLAAGKVTLVDVREPHEFAAGHIPGSVLVPLSTFDLDAVAALGSGVVFSCAAGIRSQHAIALARQAGLKLDTHYAGGFRDWALAGEPIAAG